MSNTRADLCTQIRRDILRMVYNVQSGHPGGSMGCTEFFVALYFDVMNYTEKFLREGAGLILFTTI